MNTEKLIEAVNVINDLADKFNRLPEKDVGKEGTLTAIQFHLTTSYLLELATNLADGMKLDEALRKTALGKTSLT